MKTGGDNCTLTSNALLFETEELLVGSKVCSIIDIIIVIIVMIIIIIDQVLLL